MKPEFEALWRQGEGLAASKRWPEAISAFEELHRLDPGNSGVLLQLSYVNSLAGNYRLARQYALRAHQGKPTDPKVIVELVSRLRTFNEPAAVLENVRRLGSLSRVSIPVLLQLAQRLSFLGMQSEALRFLDEARRGDPWYPPTLAARGQVLTYLGEFDRAESELERCIKRAPEFAQAHWLLSRLRKWSPANNHVARLKAEIVRPGRTPDDIVLLQYALHKELDDIGQIDEAWQALSIACSVKRSQIKYRIEESESLIDALIGMPQLEAATGQETAPTPLFIVGMHRSGTTLLEQVLAGNSAVVDMGELYDFTAQMRYACDHHCRGVIDLEIVAKAPKIDFGSVGSGYLEGIEWRSKGASFVVDKLPSNFLNIAFILASNPRAKVLHMVRDPMETCFSNLRELFSDACPYSYDQKELAAYFRLYRKLMDHWHGRYPGRILDVRYDRLVSDSESVAREVSAYCGFAFEPRMLDIGSRVRAVATASAVQVRGGIAKRDVPKWAPYAAHLQSLSAELKGLA